MRPATSKTALAGSGTGGTSDTTETVCVKERVSPGLRVAMAVSVSAYGPERVSGTKGPMKGDVDSFAAPSKISVPNKEFVVSTNPERATLPDPIRNSASAT